MKKNTYPAWALRYLTSNVSSIMRLLISSNIILIYYCVSFSIDLKCIFENIQKLWQIYDVACAAPAATAGALSCGNCFFAALLLLLPSRCCFTCICVGVRDCYLWGACWTGCSTTHKYIDIRRTCTHTHAQISVHTREEKNTRVACVRLDALVCMCMCMCAVYLMNQQQKMGATFSVFTSPQLMSAFLVVGRWRTHTCKFQHTHTRAHAYTLMTAALSVLTFAIFTFQCVRIMSRVSN